MSDELYQMVKGVSEAASAPLCKLIDAVRAGAGLVYEPTHVRRMAKAESEALIINTQTELALSELSQRAAARLTNTEFRRQANIESVVESATKELPDEVSDAPVDQDWLADFFDCCKDVGDSEVQHLWGKLLAGEVAEPGGVSRRALNLLKLMSCDEASLFHSVSHRVWRFDGKPVLFCPVGGPMPLSHMPWPGIWPYRVEQMESLEIIGAIHGAAVGFPPIRRTDPDKEIDYFGCRFSGRISHLNLAVFTKAGAELFNCLRPEAGIKDDFFQYIREQLEKSGFSCDDSDFRFVDDVE